MKKVIALGIVLSLAVCAIVISTSTGLAQPQIVQTSCDTLSFDPPRVRVEFSVINLGPIPLCSIHLGPILYPPCAILECSVPLGWDCFPTRVGGGVWQAQSSSCVLPYQKLEGFAFIIDPPYCCYDAGFDGPDGQIFYQDTVCFQCESPTPARAETWGHLKAIYR